MRAIRRAARGTAGALALCTALAATGCAASAGGAPDVGAATVAEPEPWVVEPTGRGEAIVLDGRAGTAYCEPLAGDAGPPRADDVVSLGGEFSFLRGESAALHLRRDGPRLLEIDGEGRETVVALRLSAWSNPEVPPAVVAEHLRGLMVEGPWDARLDGLLAAVDGSRCVIEIGARDDGTIPVLPPGVRALQVLHVGDRPLDLSALAACRDLRRLAVSEIGRGHVADFGPLAGCAELAWIEAPVHPSNAASMPRLDGVRAFVLDFESETEKVDFAARFPGLRRIELGGPLGASRVRDLAPLAGLPHLAVVDAAGSPVDRLPPEGFASLRRLSILGHRLAESEVAAFVATHPDCSVEHDRRALLVAAVGDADAVRIGDGGRWAPDDVPRTDRTFAGADAVRGLLACIRFDPHLGGGGACMCADSGLALEFLRDGRPIGEVSILHGTNVHGIVPHGPSVLTRESCAALRDWFAGVGLGALGRARFGDAVRDVPR